MIEVENISTTFMSLTPYSNLDKVEFFSSGIKFNGWGMRKFEWIDLIF
jgi:hypothetical protein